MNQRLEVMARLNRKKGKELYNIVSRRYVGYKNLRKKPAEGKNEISVLMTFIQSGNHNGTIEKLFAALLLALFSTLLAVDCITVFKSYIYPYISAF